MLHNKTLTIEQIENKAERLMDHLDRLLITGAMSQRDYDAATIELNLWCNAQYEALQLVDS